MSEQFNVEDENDEELSRLEESIANDKGSQPVRENIEYTGRPPRVNGPDLVTEGPAEVDNNYNVMGFVMIGLFAFAGSTAIVYLLTIATCKP